MRGAETKPQVAEFGERFLTAPDLFPARASGEPWGNAVAAVELAGQVFELQGLSDRLLDQLQNGSLPWVQGEQPSAASERRPTVIRVFRASRSDFRGKIPADFDFEFDFTPSRVRFSSFRSMAFVDLEPLVAAAAFIPEPAPPDEDFYYPYVLANIFRTVVAYRLLKVPGVLLHSAALVKDGQVFLFAGNSNVGKSTLAQEWTATGQAVLSDDLNAVFLQNDRWLVQAVPFAGRVATSLATALPLAGIFTLAQSSETRVTEVSVAQWSGNVLANTPFVNLDPYRFPQVLDVLGRIGTQTRTGAVSRQKSDLDFSPLNAEPE